MENSTSIDAPRGVVYLVGESESIGRLSEIPAKSPFDDVVLDYLNALSRNLMKNPAAKAYPDVTAFAFWIRRASTQRLKERFGQEGALRLGRGVVFHIAPSNVPVNFAYSLVAGLLCGNANIVRVPERDFEQIRIIVDEINETLRDFGTLKPYIHLIRYGHEREINNWLSAIADVRVIWGGNRTIAELRQSPMPPRSGEVTFADRFSLAVIDSDAFLGIEDKAQVVEGFYNDTFLTDQNACTSPRLVVWMGERVEVAKKTFWALMHELVTKKYDFQTIQGVNKLTKCCLAAAAAPGLKLEEHSDNLVVRVKVPSVGANLIEFFDNSGFFFEYDCADILDLFPLCNDSRCQTVSYLGDTNILQPLLRAGVKGIDRVVPIGRTMDFDLIWDGYQLPVVLTRTISVI